MTINRRTRARRYLVKAAQDVANIRWPVNDPADLDDATAALERAALDFAKACGWQPPKEKR